jgi:hypothetical protein
MCVVSVCAEHVADACVVQRKLLSLWGEAEDEEVIRGGGLKSIAEARFAEQLP